ncbi:MAG: transposase [Cyanobacteria bacterium P01_A01_bin.17]
MTLEEFIASNPDPGVASGYISSWEKYYQADGISISGLHLAHKGSMGYLSASQRACVESWIQQKSQQTLWELIDHIEQEYQVLYRSLKSYYTLLKAAGMSWHQGQKSPKYDESDESVVQERTESIHEWLAAHEQEIRAGRIKSLCR